ncbi:MAG: NrfD/PsrC family molybdoenzyme membrane anchor subunit [Chloroflexia bacterium]
MDLENLLSEEYKKSPHGAAHDDPSDAYRGVPFLKQPVWKNEIAAYFFLGGVSAGSALLGSVAELVGGPAHRKFAHTAHYVSFVTFLPCPLLLIDDLGVPAKFHHMLRVFKPSSPMNLGSWAFAIHGAGATVTVLRMLAADGKLPLIGAPIALLPERLLAVLGIPSSLLLAGYTGVLLGTTSIPVWYTSRLLGALFTSGAISTGAAAVVAASAVRDIEDHYAMQSAAAIRLITDVSTLISYVAYARTTGAASTPLWTGERRILNVASFAMLGLSILGGALAISGRASRAGRLLSAISSLASGALMRWAIVRAGRISAEDRQGALHAMRATEQRPGWTPPA